MSDMTHMYQPPTVAPETNIPSEVADYLDGRNLLAKTQALRVSTVDEQGWPHASLLSAGDMLALPPARVRFLIFSESVTAANLLRDGRVTVTVSVDGGMWELRFRARRVTELSLDASLACFDAALAAAHFHSVPYAALTSGVTLGIDRDAQPRDQFYRFVDGYMQYPGEFRRLDDAPWQESVVEGDVNLYDLMPLFRLNRGDGGHFLDKACAVSRDPDDPDNDDVQNVGIYRLQVKGPNRLGILAVPQHDIAIHLAHAEQRGEDLPVAIALGTDPIVTLMGATPMLYNQLEYRMAGALQGEPYHVVSTEKGLDVPWGSEYVLEGRMLAGQREVEGPFGEFPGYYSGCHRYPVIEIDRVSHRKDPIYDAVYVGRPWTEIDYLQAMTTSAPIYAQVSADFPEVSAVNALYTHGLVVVVSTKTRYGGFAKAVALRVLATTHGLGYAKVVIVVDDNVDPFDLKQVMWAISVKVNPAHDAMILPNLSVNPLDPAGQPTGVVTKMIIDATTPVPPDVRGDYGQELDTSQRTDEWRTQLASLIKDLR